MSTSRPDVPHPLLVKPILWVGDVPSDVEWSLVEDLFSRCGPVRLGDKKSMASTKRGRWSIIFPNVISAEMALATMSGMQVQNVSPPWYLILSHSPLLEESLPKIPVLPFFLRQTNNEQPFRMKHDAQAVFCWFRRAGPLVSIRLDVDVGYEGRACVIQFWREEHALSARKLGLDIHPFTRTLSFSLQVYNPWNLYCTKLGSSMSKQELRAQFEKYGQILSTSMMREGKCDAFGFVSFSTIEEAQRARNEMNGLKLGDKEVAIRYHEPNALNKIHPHPDARVTLTRFTEYNAPDSIPKFRQSPFEGRVKERLAAAKDKRIRAEQAEAFSATQKLQAVADEMDKSKTLTRAEQAETEARKALELAKLAVEEVLLTLERAKTHLIQASKQADSASSDKQEAFEHLKAATKIKDDAVEREEAARKNKEDALREEHELYELCADDTTDVETDSIDDTGEEEFHDQPRWGKWGEEANQSKAETEEFLRKMEELRKQEQADRRRRAGEKVRDGLQESLKKMAEFEAEEKRRKLEKEEAQKQAQKVKEERARREREEAERKAREKREKEEREKKEAEEHLTRYHTAAAKERIRCRLRDEARWDRYAGWTIRKSIEWFRVVSDEFDDIKFSTTQPLTFESVPWPTLLSPYSITHNDVDWQAVENFFEMLECMVDDQDYKALVEKAHRRFHPDKWRSRGLLNTVLDEKARETVEKVGNIVAQALTPIWLESRSTK